MIKSFIKLRHYNSINSNIIRNYFLIRSEGSSKDLSIDSYRNLGRRQKRSFKTNKNLNLSMEKELEGLNISAGVTASPSKVDAGLMQKWEAIQNDLRKKILTLDTECWQLNDELSGLKLVAGLDISCPKDAHDQNDSDAYAAVAIYSFPDLKLVHDDVEFVRLDVPYVPGFLAFRELQPLIRLLKKVIKEHPELKPDVILVDGNGQLHPQKCGVACHIGFHMQIPTIGVAKNLYVMDGIDCTRKMVQDMISVGDYTYIRDKNNCKIGLALKTTEKAKNPVYVSIGHKISLETARKTVLACCKHRVPEPVRHADFISRELIRKLEGDKNLNLQTTKDNV